MTSKRSASAVTPEMVRALAYLRLKARSDDSQVSRMINVLDNAGVFAEIDAVTEELEIMFSSLADDHGEPE